MKFNLRQLSYFIATAECGSALRAANAVHVSQPSISNAIRDLEVTLGQPLFHRRYAKGMSLTPFGRRKLIEARHLISDAQLFEADSTSDTDSTGNIAFGYFSTLGPSHVPALLRILGQQLPRLNIDLAECNLEEINSRLIDGRIEVALTYDVGLGNQVSKEVLAELNPYAVLPKNHDLARQKTVSLKDLAKQRFILVNLPVSREFLLAPFRQYGLDPEIIYEVKSIEMVRGMVANGLGVSLLTTRPEHNRTYDGLELVNRPIREAVVAQKLIAAYPASHPPGRTVAAFLNCLRCYFAGDES
jgi:DNA-binding transcriptional LysR family regulator